MLVEFDDMVRTTMIEERIRNDRGSEIALSVFSATNAKAVVVIASGTGIPQRFYSKFARHLADDGFDVVTFDYEGIGASLNGAIRECSATMQSLSLIHI